MKLEEVKALGAPFRKAEIQVSMRKKIARLVLIVPGREAAGCPMMDFPILEGTKDWEQAGNAIIATAGSNGLLDVHSITVIVDIDSPTQVH